MQPIDLAIGFLLPFEYAVTLADSAEEDRYRRLTRIERINHMLLALNTGLYAACIGWQAWSIWRPAPTALIVRAPGVAGVVLTLCAVGVAIWAVRDGRAARRMRRQAGLDAPGVAVR